MLVLYASGSIQCGYAFILRCRVGAGFMLLAQAQEYSVLENSWGASGIFRMRPN